MKRNERMLAPEVRKLAKRVGELVTRFGLIRTPATYPELGEYEGWSERFDCRVTVCPCNIEVGKSPWLATCLYRDHARHAAMRDGIPQRLYLDAHQAIGANMHSGKCNCHIFHRCTASEAFDLFVNHLRVLGLHDRIDDMKATRDAINLARSGALD